MENYTYNFKSFLDQVTPWWLSSQKKVAWLGTIILLATSAFSVYTAVILNNWHGNTYGALENKDYAAFLKQALLFIPLAATAIVTFTFNNFCSAWLSFKWRSWMTHELQNKWLSNKHFYKISASVDNPDQRIAEDISTFSSMFISLLIAFFREVINLITFAVLLWGLSYKLDFHVFGKKVAIPGILLWMAIIYSLFFIFVTFKAGKPLVKMDQEKEKSEANFRFKLMRIFERKEEIAFLAGESFEGRELDKSFNDIKKSYYAIFKRNIYMHITQNLYMNAGQFIPMFLVAPFYFSSIITMALLMRINGIFREVCESMLSIATSYQSIATLIAASKRLHELEKLIGSQSPQEMRRMPSGNSLKIKDLKIFSPQHKLLWIPPEITLKLGDKKLLMAPSGQGKTTLLRILAGLYPNFEISSQEGAATIPKNLMFIPQRPYMPLGTLRQAICYPSGFFNEQEITIALEVCSLSHLTPLLDIADDYQHKLSLGEQQRINFARVLLHKPKWVIMDEPFSNLNISISENLGELLVTHLPTSGVLIVSHQKVGSFCHREEHLI